jgi:hypothetical protein
MKKFFTIALATMAMSSAFAAQSGTLILKGTVPRLLEITVNPEAIASNLPLDTTQANTLVAVVNEKSNSKTGYNVSISSANQGQLVHESEASSVVNYSLRYNGNLVDLALGETYTYSGAGANNNNRNVNISYTGIDHDLLIEGDYSDTVTFTIAAN